MTDTYSGATGAANGAKAQAEEASLHIAETAEKVFARAQETYGDVRRKAEEKFSDADALMRERPYVALGIAAFAGFLLGHIISSGRPDVIYLKDAR